MVQFHLHQRTLYGWENICDGSHLVHQNTAGQLAVIGVFIKAREENSFLEPIWEIMPETEGVAIAEGVSICGIYCRRIMPTITIVAL